MNVKFIDLDRQLLPIREAIDTAMCRVIARGDTSLGPEIAEFEDLFAEYVGAEHAIGVANGSAAMRAALASLGVGPGDEVITSSFSCGSPIAAITAVGATPVVVDIDPATYALDPNAVREALSRKTVGILPVHLFGQTADMTQLAAIAEEHSLFLLENATQAIGAVHEEKGAGTFGDAGCFGFFPTQTLGAFGDGGMVVTNDDDVARKVRRARDEDGASRRLDALQAAILTVKLDSMPDWIHARQKHAAEYDAALPGGIRPGVGPKNSHAYDQYIVRVSDRDGLRERMWSEGIETQIYYPTSCECRPCFANHDVRVSGRLAEAHAACDEVLALPVYPQLTDDERQRVIGSIHAFLSAQAA